MVMLVARPGTGQMVGDVCVGIGDDSDMDPDLVCEGNESVEAELRDAAVHEFRDSRLGDVEVGGGNGLRPAECDDTFAQCTHQSCSDAHVLSFGRGVHDVIPYAHWSSFMRCWAMGASL